MQTKNIHINQTIAANIKILLLRRMIRIRAFEDKAAEGKNNGKIPGSVHCAHGQEAIDVGACNALANEDHFIGNHRPHGFMIARGVDINALMAEIYGKETGTNGGKGGSMHVSDKKIGSLGATAIVGSGLPVACGAAFASKYKQDGKVACVFFGDGASNEGTFHESLNLASIWKLPVIFFLINNGVAITTTLPKTSVAQDLYHRAKPYEIFSMKINGQDVEEVYNAVTLARQKILEGNCPVLIEAKTIRFREHAEGSFYARMTETGYRDNAEVDYYIRNQDPIKLYSEQLISEKVITKEDLEKIISDEEQRIEEAVKFALESPIPDNHSAYTNIFK